MAIKTREKLIDVARQLFARNGVSNTTINDIAAASSKGRRTFYTYFKNKLEIYNAVLESESERLVASLREITITSEPIEDRLRQYLRFRLEHNSIQAETQYKSWFKLDRRRFDKVTQLVSEKENELLSALLEKGCQQGVFRPERCELLMGFINQSISMAMIPQATEAEREAREKIFNNLIEFVVSDVCVEKKD